MFSFKRKIETEIIISSNIEEVYSRIINFNDYVNWSPFIISINGDLKVGGKINVTIRPENQNGMSFNPTIVSVKNNKEISWLGHFGFKGIFDGEHYFILEKISKEQVKFVHGENFSGLLVPVLWFMVKKSTTSGFIAHNEALKKLVES
jgi:hypothetical protein